MSFTERLRILIDVDSKNATTGIAGFRNAVSGADGMVGKFKAGANSAMQSVKANAGALAMAGGAALIAFGAKAVEAFTSTAKAAIDMGKATGLSTEQASRWIAVGDDFEVTASQIATAMGRIGKNMDSDAMKKYGIETRDAAGHAKSSNEVFLDVLDVLNNTAPAERARVAAELLGKGWQGIAPLLGKTREEYEKMLGSVESGQVITAKEAAKAEKMRLAQDALADALDEVTLAFGALVAEAAPTIEMMADLTLGATEYFGVAKQIADLGNPFGWASVGVDDLLALEGGAIAASVAAGVLSPAVAEAAATAEDMADAYEDVAAAVESTAEAFGGLLGLLDFEDAVDNVADAFDKVAETAAEAAEAVAAGAADSAAKTRDAEAAQRDLIRSVVNLKDEYESIPAEKITEVVTLIEEGEFAAAQAMIDALTADAVKNITVYVEGKFGGSLGSPAPIKGKRAAGGPVSQSGAYLVGELGPEVVNIPGGSNVIPNHQLGGGATNVTVNVNVGPGADPVSVGRATADALAAYYRNGGSRP